MYTYLIKTFQASLKLIDATDETTALSGGYIATTNSILIVGFNFEVLGYLEGLLKPLSSQEN